MNTEKKSVKCIECAFLGILTPNGMMEAIDNARRLDKWNNPDNQGLVERPKFACLATTDDDGIFVKREDVPKGTYLTVLSEERECPKFQIHQSGVSPKEAMEAMKMEWQLQQIAMQRKEDIAREDKRHQQEERQREKDREEAKKHRAEDHRRFCMGLAISVLLIVISIWAAWTANQRLMIELDKKSSFEPAIVAPESPNPPKKKGQNGDPETDERTGGPAVPASQ